MIRLSATLRTVTPAFLGSAETTDCELRPPAIRAALRFWFRFLEGGRCSGDFAAVRAEESRLFGSINSGVGLVSVRLRQPLRQVVRGEPAFRPYCGLAQPLGYLGYGPLAWSKDDHGFSPLGPKPPGGRPAPPRALAPESQTAELDLLFPRRATADDVQRVYQALWAWTHLGGLGARSRRGWGSLALMRAIRVDSNGTEQPMTPAPLRDCADPAALQAALRETLQQMVPTPRSGATFTHWSADAEILCPLAGSDWKDALTKLGNRLVRFRTNWSKRVRPGRGRFWSDYQIANEFLTVAHWVPGANDTFERAAFGLPHNYMFGSLKRRHHHPSGADVLAEVAVRGEPQARTLSRRASPLLMRAHPLRGGRVAVVLTFVPAPLLPPGASLVLRAQGNGGPDPQTLAVPGDGAIRAFLASFTGGGRP